MPVGIKIFGRTFPDDRTSDNYPVGRSLKARRRSFEFASQYRGRALAPEMAGKNSGSDSRTPLIP